MIYHCCWIIRNGEIPDPQIMTINVWNFKIDVSPYINDINIYNCRLYALLETHDSLFMN